MALLCSLRKAAATVQPGAIRPDNEGIPMRKVLAVTLLGASLALAACGGGNEDTEADAMATDPALGGDAMATDPMATDPGAMASPTGTSTDGAMDPGAGGATGDAGAGAGAGGAGDTGAGGGDTGTTP